MTSVYQIYQYVSSNSIKFGFYDSKGNLFAFGNASQGIEMADQNQEKFTGFCGDLPREIPVTELEAPEKTEYLHRFLLALLDLEEAYKKIEELSPG